MERVEDDTSVMKRSFRWNTQDSELEHSQGVGFMFVAFSKFWLETT